MRPLSTVEKPAFREMLQSIASFEIVFPGRKGIKDDIEKQFNEMIMGMKTILQKRTFVSTSADIWSSRCASYLGMTVNYLDDDLSMKTLVLCFKELKGRHTYDVIAHSIAKVHESFGLQTSKITHTVTDGGSNFVKAFKIFSSSDDENASEGFRGFPSKEADDGSDSDESNCGNDDNDEEQRIKVDIVIEPVAIDLTFEEVDIVLPPQMRCIAHQLNLACTSDVLKYLKEKRVDMTYVSVFSKLHHFWNKTKRSALLKEQIKEKFGIQLPIPVKTRWNSLFDATKVITSLNRAKIKGLASFALRERGAINEKEWTFLDEYVKLLEPVAQALDILQGDKTVTLGDVLPTLIVVQMRLRSFTDLNCAENVRIGLLSNLKKRFPFLDLENMTSVPYVLATVSQPKFKLDWIADANDAEKIKKLFIAECHKFYKKSDEQVSETSGSGNENVSDFYSQLMSVSFKSGKIMNEAIYDAILIDSRFLSADNEENISDANFVENRFLDYINDKNKKLSSLFKYDIIKSIYLKYNTTLPSSAPVERIFSTGLEIFTPRRNRLSPKTFEHLLMLKYNRDIVKGLDDKDNK